MAWLKKMADAIKGNEDFSDIKSSTIREILNGDILSKNFLRKQYFLLILIALIAFLYVGNRYSCETQLAKEISLKKQILDLKYESMTISADLMRISRQSNVLNLVNSRGLDLIQTNTPPIVIEDSVIEK